MLFRYKDLPVNLAFGLKAADVVTVNEQMTLTYAADEAILVDADGRRIGKFDGVPIDLLQAFLASIDGEKPLARIFAEPPFAEHRGLLEALVGSLLGVLFFVPAAIDALEARIPAIELLRFPHQSRYAVPRAYWENSSAVRDALDSFYMRLGDVAAFSDGLRGLHRLATTGADGETYYGGAGGIATIPGEYRATPIENRFGERKKWIMATWLRLLNCDLAITNQGTIRSVENIPLLQISADGSLCRHLYGQHGEYLALQVNEIRERLSALKTVVDAGDSVKALYGCALFHHAFAHAHPFNNINNSIAMNIVNDILRKADIGVLPHLYFDQIAYFMQPEQYAEFFAIAAKAHMMNDDLGYDRQMTNSLLDTIEGDPDIAIDGSPRT